MTVRLWVLAILVPAMAGCIQATTPSLGNPNTLGEAAGAHSLEIQATKCMEAGAVTTNPDLPMFGGVLPAPWEPADTSGYLGAPATGTAIGVYHAAFACDMWVVNGRHEHEPSGGFVGILVEPPPFDEVGRVDHNILVATISSRNDDVVQHFHDAGIYVYPGIGHVDADESGEPWFVRAVLATSGDGVYESILTMNAQGDVWPTLRLWFIAQGEDGKLHPAYFDMNQKKGQTFVGPGLFDHVGSGDHLFIGTAAPVGGLGFRGFDFTVTFGVLKATVEKMWDH